MVQGLGLFSATAPSTAHVAPNESFTFSFDLQSPVTPSTQQGADLFVTGITDCAYTLGGVSQAVTLDSVEFDPDGFALSFGDQTKLEFVGADLGSDGTVQTPTWGSYAVFVLTPPPHVVPSIRMPSAALAPQQIGTAMVVTTGPGPEPASWALLIAGFGATGAALRRRRAVLA
ncbi:MAG: PEP-CTERM sorting domain-containing protein [Phenylobacterium sp.]|nr:MAG: PEP-CTERM sorting domain-containing protein [Phenylobacterium sp.]